MAIQYLNTCLDNQLPITNKPYTKLNKLLEDFSSLDKQNLIHAFYTDSEIKQQYFDVVYIYILQKQSNFLRLKESSLKPQRKWLTNQKHRNYDKKSISIKNITTEKLTAQKLLLRIKY
ncbi:unnamed protein product (macronuclear) [Paramecium tetraurelia]|uniref:Uncharacterized protein n=1 Tax=Paramecium tetraurelia TaxID=5888 RepID=A0CH64_PARTE|nr:uncharacterized protein GSPATT00007571001 [Paramecium tetraurelia]CAK70131.1 unnamed protein product [Paramecium tetraurelia]|eukprot:XP_001437528.1 hypothetical protein (macronuclear) [Paramecium tetraurelia strain d4-2]